MGKNILYIESANLTLHCKYLLRKKTAYIRASLKVFQENWWNCQFLFHFLGNSSCLAVCYYLILKAVLHLHWRNNRWEHKEYKLMIQIWNQNGLTEYFLRQVVLIEKVRTRHNHHIDFKLQEFRETLPNYSLSPYCLHNFWDISLRNLFSKFSCWDLFHCH